MRTYTPKEVVAIEQLQLLMKRWPKDLFLFGASGTLYVVHRDDYKEGLKLDEEGIAVLGVYADGGQGDL